MSVSRADPGQAADDRRLGRLMRAGTLVTLAAALVAVVVPPPVGSFFGGSAVAAVICLPLLRVLVLIGRWIRARDMGFALAGASLLLVVAAGMLVAFLRS